MALVGFSFFTGDEEMNTVGTFNPEIRIKFVRLCDFIDYIFCRFIMGTDANSTKGGIAFE